MLHIICHQGNAINTTVRYNYIPVNIAKQNADSTKSWKGCRATGILIHFWWQCKMVQPLGKMVVSCKTEHSYHIIQQLCSLVFTPKRVKKKQINVGSHKKFTPGCIKAALFLIVKSWKQPRFPSVGEWINCGISRQQNIIRHLKTHEKPWRNLKCTLLGKRSQS